MEATCAWKKRGRRVVEETQSQKWILRQLQIILYGAKEKRKRKKKPRSRRAQRYFGPGKKSPTEEQGAWACWREFVIGKGERPAGWNFDIPL